MLIYPNHYPNITIACYPAGSGGNFLLNCLSLSDNSILRHANLHSLTYEEKVYYLLETLQTSINRTEWSDLGLGCRQFYGVEAESYMSQYHDIIAYRMNSTVTNAMLDGHHIFLGGQTTIMMRNYLSFWPKARIIFFTNYRSFIQQRPQLNPLPDIDKIFDQIHPVAVANMHHELGDRARDFDVAASYGTFAAFWTEYISICEWIGINPAQERDIENYYTLWQQSLPICDLS